MYVILPGALGMRSGVSPGAAARHSLLAAVMRIFNQNSIFFDFFPVELLAQLDLRANLALWGCLAGCKRAKFCIFSLSQRRVEPTQLEKKESD